MSRNVYAVKATYSIISGFNSIHALEEKFKLSQMTWSYNFKPSLFQILFKVIFLSTLESLKGSLDQDDDNDDDDDGGYNNNNNNNNRHGNLRSNIVVLNVEAAQNSACFSLLASFLACLHFDLKVSSSQATVKCVPDCRVSYCRK
jgi:hypothetical protein